MPKSAAGCQGASEHWVRRSGDPRAAGWRNSYLLPETSLRENLLKAQMEFLPRTSDFFGCLLDPGVSVPQRALGPKVPGSPGSQPGSQGPSVLRITLHLVFISIHEMLKFTNRLPFRYGYVMPKSAAGCQGASENWVRRSRDPRAAGWRNSYLLPETSLRENLLKTANGILAPYINFFWMFAIPRGLSAPKSPGPQGARESWVPLTPRVPGSQGPRVLRITLHLVFTSEIPKFTNRLPFRYGYVGRAPGPLKKKYTRMHEHEDF